MHLLSVRRLVTYKWSVLMDIYYPWRIQLQRGSIRVTTLPQSHQQLIAPNVHYNKRAVAV